MFFSDDGARDRADLIVHGAPTIPHDPDRQFIPVQNRMAQQDALMEYLKFTSSAIFAVPPGAGPGEYVGQALFA